MDLDQAYLEVFKSAAGRIVLEDLFWNYFERPGFDPSSPSAQALAFREGQRSVVLDIRACMRRAQSPDGSESWAVEEELEN